MGDVVSGCSCELFSGDASHKSKNKYTTTDTESDSDGESSNNDSDSDDSQYNNQYKSVKTSLQTTTTKTQFIKHIQKQNVISNKPDKIKKNQPKVTKNKKINPDTPIPNSKSKYKSKKRKKKTKRKKKEKKKRKKLKLERLKLERSKSCNQMQTSSRPKLHFHRHSELINNDLLTPPFTFMNPEFEAFMGNITKTQSRPNNTGNQMESTQTDNVPSSPPYKNVTFIDNNNNNNILSPKLNLIDETSDNMDNRSVIYHTIDNDSCKSLSDNTFPNTNLFHIRSQSVGPPILDLNDNNCNGNLQRLERGHSYTLTPPRIHYNNTPIMTPYSNTSDSIPSLPRYPSFTKSNSVTYPSQRNSYKITFPPSKVLHNYSSSFDTTTIIHDNTGVNLNKRRKSKPTKVLTKENSNDWSVDRIVSENDAMEKQLLFLKRYNSEKELNNKSTTHWIDENYNM